MGTDERALLLKIVLKMVWPTIPLTCLFFFQAVFNYTSSQQEKLFL